MRATKHPAEAVLALHAGGDLGAIARWRVRRHLKQCEICQEEMAAFQEVRSMTTRLAEIPEVSWNRLAAEMHANIRLGLAAGECVRETPARSESGRFTLARATVAMAGLAALVAAGVFLERPTPKYSAGAPVSQAMTLRATADGIQVSQGGETLGLKHAAGIKNVSYSANTQGSLGESYIDPLTGDVTVTRVSW